MPKRTKSFKKSVNHSVESSPPKTLIERYQAELSSPGSYFNLIVGLLIILIAGVLVMNYFKSTSSNLSPASQIAENQTSPTPDVNPTSLPGNYTVKEGDTLFTIAQKYYNDGYKYGAIIAENKLSNENLLAVGQVLVIPKVSTDPVVGGTGGSENQTIWGEKITADTYTVLEGDWLSKISGRAYGDIAQFDKIAKANNISDPNVIAAGTVLKIPR
jgi:nucleoid-associated protein YgaU